MGKRTEYLTALGPFYLRPVAVLKGSECTTSLIWSTQACRNGFREIVSVHCPVSTNCNVLFLLVMVFIIFPSVLVLLFF